MILPVSEDDLLTAAIDAALMFGWSCHHDRRSDLAKQQGNTGFPDLVLARDGRVIFAELKGTGGKLAEAQVAWLLALRGQNPQRLPGQPLVVIWWPADLDDIIEILRGNKTW